MRLNIKKINNLSDVPWDLLLLADPSKKLVEEYLKDGKTYIALQENKTIGVYVLLKLSPHDYELKNIAIAKQYQGLGMGKILILDAIEKAKQQGAKKIIVGTGNSSLSQLALYQKCGFKITEIEKDFFTKNYKEEIIENGIKCVDKIILSLELI